VDRIDLWLGVASIDHKKLEDPPAGEQPDTRREKSIEIRKRVERARDIQHKRFAGSSILTNAEMSVRDIKKYCALDSASRSALQQAAIKMDLSPRAYHRVIKLARTIADLAVAPDITQNHIYEALQYRPTQKED
jgi:magnesium chelatase family protein